MWWWASSRPQPGPVTRHMQEHKTKVDICVLDVEDGIIPGILTEEAGTPRPYGKWTGCAFATAAAVENAAAHAAADAEHAADIAAGGGISWAAAQQQQQEQQQQRWHHWDAMWEERELREIRAEHEVELAAREQQLTAREQQQQQQQQRQQQQLQRRSAQQQEQLEKQKAELMALHVPEDMYHLFV